MLKYESPFLPDGADELAYKKIPIATEEAVAWELLRRKEDYWADFDFLAERIAMAKAEEGLLWKRSRHLCQYDPPNDENLPYDSWLSRSALADGPEPQVGNLSSILAAKWGIAKMADFREEYVPEIRFTPASLDFPRIITTADDFLLETAITDQERYLAPEYGMLPADRVAMIFDLTAPKGVQFIRAALIFLRLYRTRKIKRTKTERPISPHIVRHLRVLDLIRCNPAITDAALAIALGFDEENEHGEDVSAMTANDKGAAWRDQALEAQRRYRQLIPCHSKKVKKPV